MIETEGNEISSAGMVKLYLGSLKLDLDSLLNLHPGAQIEFPIPEKFEAILELGGGDWAEVQVSFQDNQAQLLVQRLCGLGKKAAA